MLTAKDFDDDRILGLEMGADDYIAKPFNTREVVARVKAVLRRSSQFLQSQNKQVLEYPDLMINLSEYRVVAFGREVTFTAKEMELLWCLASNPGIVFHAISCLKNLGVYVLRGYPHGRYAYQARSPQIGHSQGCEMGYRDRLGRWL